MYLKIFTRFSIVLFSFFVMASGNTHAATYHFSSSSGKDSRSSSKAQNPQTPWKSIEKLNSIFSTLQPGDKILFKRGDTFYGEIKITKSGSSGAPISIGSFGSGNKPIVTSLSFISDWKSRGGNIYEAQVNGIKDDVNIVLVEDQIYEMGRFPNEIDDNQGYLTIQSYNGGTITSSQLQAPTNFTGGEVVIRKNNWIIDRHYINYHSGSSVNYNTSGSGYQPQIGYGFFVQNHPGTLDQYGEWFFDKKNKTILIYYDKGRPSSSAVKVAIKEQVIDIRNGVNNIAFIDLSIMGANENVIRISNSSNISITNIEIKYAGKNGVNALGTKKFKMENSLIEDVFGSGVFFQWQDSDMIIKNNTFNRTHIFAGMGRNGDENGNTIHMSSSSNNGLIESNRILNSGYQGIVFNGNNTLVKNNVIDNYCFVKDDGAGIYTYTGANNTEFTNRKVIGNIVINGIGAVGGTKPFGPNDLPYVKGIYMDDNSSGVEISGNTVANVASSGIFIHNSRNMDIQNNNVFNVGNSLLLVHDHLGNPNRNITLKNNNFLAKTEDQSHINVRSKLDDVREMGSFDQNVYARPANDNYTINTNLPNGSGQRMQKNLDLNDWSSLYGIDKNSKKSPVVVPQPKILESLGVNKIINGLFKSGSNGSYCWSPNNNCNISTETNPAFSGNSLKVEMPSAGILVFKFGSIKKENYYNLRFKGTGNRSLLLKAYFRQVGSPYAKVSEVKTIKLDNARADINELLIASSSNPQTDLVIESADPNLTYWINNLEIVQVEVEKADAKDFIFFEYNDTHSPKSFGLSGNYVDLRGVKLSKSVTIEPFSSVILLKADKENSGHANREMFFHTSPQGTGALTSNTKSGDLQSGQKIKVEAEAKDGFVFDHWSIAGEKVGEESVLEFEMTEKIKGVTGHFREFVAPEAEIITLEHHSEHESGTNIQIGLRTKENDGVVEKIELYQGDSLFAELTDFESGYTWENVPAGQYTLTAKTYDTKGNASASEPISIQVNENSDKPLGNLDFNMGPNPTSNHLNLIFNDLGEDFDVEIQVISLTGIVQKIYKERVGQSKLTIDVEDLSHGVYLLHINYGSKTNIIKKFIKEN